MSCKHDCDAVPEFPARIFNRPGLPEISYRIGAYAEMRRHMLAALDQQTALAGWTHRGADDPGIAFIEGAAIVGDILSFYQQLYANEAYLRTAKWRESVADLIKLLGYRMAPGLGGHARFALAAKGDRPVEVPAGFGIKTQLDGAPKPAVFETSAPLLAYPHLSEFHLYRPRSVPDIAGGDVSFVVAATPGAVALKAGDRILVGVPRDGGQSLDHSQVLIVEETKDSFGSTIVTMKGAYTALGSLSTLVKPVVAAIAATATFGQAAQLKSAIVQPVSAAVNVAGPTLNAGIGLATLFSTAELRAYKLAGSFRHFGHNAPTKQIDVNSQGRATSSTVSTMRRLDATTGAPASPSLSSRHFPLDGEVDSVIAGATLLVEANLSPDQKGGSARKRIVERQIQAVDRQSLAWGPMNGASSVLTLDRSLALTEGSVHLNHADIRGITLHQVEGAGFALRAVPKPLAAKSGTALDFYGTAAEAAALEKRTLLLAGPGTAIGEAQVVDVADAPAGTAAEAIFRRVTLDRVVAYADFEHETPAVTVFGNVAAATEGKSEAEIPLGDGDTRQVFQTFALPTPPLTYLLDPAHEPPHAPELTIRVDGRRWQRVDSLFASGPRDAVYVVREDAAGKSYVQFGDGKSGARLPSGRNNVVAQFRSGSGSNGALKPDSKPQPAGRLPGLDKIAMHEPVTGGAAPESEESARVAAPGRMQSLARIVSLADFEAEALAIAGVLKARASWALVDGTPRVLVTILTLSRSPADTQAVADTLLALYQARGPARCPVTVVQGRRRQLSIAARVGCDPTYREDAIRAGILAALGAAEGAAELEHGLFGWQERQFGQTAHGSEVVAAIQNVPGVAFVELSEFGPRPSASYRYAALLSLKLRTVAPARRLATCPDDEMLALAVADLALSLSQAEAALEA